jgi:hypothetical protein
VHLLYLSVLRLIPHYSCCTALLSRKLISHSLFLRTFQSTKFNWRHRAITEARGQLFFFLLPNSKASLCRNTVAMQWYALAPIPVPRVPWRYRNVGRPSTCMFDIVASVFYAIRAGANAEWQRDIYVRIRWMIVIPLEIEGFFPLSCVEYVRLRLIRSR